MDKWNILTTNIECYWRERKEDGECKATGITCQENLCPLKEVIQLEDYIPTSDYERDKEREEIFEKILKLELYYKNANCCFCGTIKGALIRLYQGWCCIKCFRRILNKPKVDQSHNNQQTKPCEVSGNSSHN